MEKRYARWICALFCLFLGGFFVFHLALPDREKSEVENRTLQQLPEFSIDAVIDGIFTKQVEDYIADQFPLRDQWTGAKARSEQLIGKREFNGVYLCDDTLIARVDEPDESLVEKNFGYVEALEKNTGLPVYLGLIPSAAEIWKEQLPSGAYSYDQQQVLAQAAATGLSLIDYASVLGAHADEPIFYRTDHHWTTLGAYYGYTALMDAFGMEAEPMGEVQQVTDSFSGTLYSTSGVHWLKPDTIEIAAEDAGLHVTSYRTGTAEEGVLYDWSKLEGKDKYSFFLGGNQPLCVVENENIPDGERLLVIRDSYADSLTPFLSQNFSEVHLMDPRYYKGSVAQYAQEHDIDRILVSFSIPNFIEEKNLAVIAQ